MMTRKKKEEGEEKEEREGRKEEGRDGGRERRGKERRNAMMKSVHRQVASLLRAWATWTRMESKQQHDTRMM